LGRDVSVGLLLIVLVHRLLCLRLLFVGSRRFVGW
jgi:hypothetical protein